MDVDLVDLSGAALDMTAKNLVALALQGLNTSVVTVIVKTSRTRGMKSPSVSSGSTWSPEMIDSLDVFLSPRGILLENFGLNSSVILVNFGSDSSRPVESCSEWYQ
jgi:hypothetical protein